MSYRFERSESARDGVRRVVLERLEHARKQLERELRTNPEEAVHTARKDLKKARSAIRLVREELGKAGYRRDNELLGDAGRELSAARDAAVSVETLEKLRSHFGSRLGKVQARAVKKALAAARARAGEDAPKQEASSALELIAAAGHEVQGWNLDENGWALLGPGVKREYARGREQVAAVESDPTAEAVHEWRKRVKDLWYFVRLLEDAWPEVFPDVADEAHELSNLLGDHHDLTVLAESASEGELGLDANEKRSLRSLAERRQQEIVVEALPLGKRLYAEKPKAFERRLGAYWEAWRA